MDRQLIMKVLMKHLAAHHMNGFLQVIADDILATQQPIELKEDWISVGNALPEEGKSVFISSVLLGGKSCTDIAFYTYGGVHEFDDEDDNFPECFDEKAGVSYLPKGWWVTDADEEKCFQRKATHWRPLPEPPQTKG